MRFGVCAAVIVLTLAAFASNQPSIPHVLRFKEAGRSAPVWVSEHAALDGNGELRPDRFLEWQAARLRRLLEKNAAGTCEAFLTQPALEHHRAQATLDDVIANARIIVSGTVVMSAQGFYHGTPGTLLAVHNVERLKAIGRVSHRDTLYVFIPQATIRTRSGAICSTMAGALPAIPHQGDSLLAFAYGSPNDEQEAILELDVAQHLLVQPRGAKRMLPNRLAKAIGSGAELEETLRRVRAHARPSPEASCGAAGFSPPMVASTGAQARRLRASRRDAGAPTAVSVSSGDAGGTLAP